MFRLADFNALEKKLEATKNARHAYTQIITKHQSLIAQKEQRDIANGYAIEVDAESSAEKNHKETHPEYRNALILAAELCKTEADLEKKLAAALPQYEAKLQNLSFHLATHHALQDDIQILITTLQHYVKHLEKMAVQLSLSPDERNSTTSLPPAKQELVIKLHHAETIGNILHSQECNAEIFNRLQTMLNDEMICAAFAKPHPNEDDPDNTHGIQFLIKIEATMNTILQTLANFVMPVDTNALHYLVLNEMLEYLSEFLEHLAAKLRPALIKLPDKILLALATPSLSSVHNYPMKISHQFQSELEPWNFSIDIARLSHYIEAFTSNDHYLLKKMDATITLLNCLHKKNRSDSDKIHDAIEFFTSSAIQQIFLAHKQHFFSIFNESKAGHSETFVTKMMNLIKYEKKMTAILESTQHTVRPK